MYIRLQYNFLGAGSNHNAAKNDPSYAAGRASPRSSQKTSVYRTKLTIQRVCKYGDPVRIDCA
jgi:hypothetical protein